MMGGTFASPSPAAAPMPEKSKDAPADEPNPYRDVLNNMFDSGLEVQKSYQKNMEAIFDTYLRNGTGGSDEAAATPAAPKPSK
jgi:hypothetical protein